MRRSIRYSQNFLRNTRLAERLVVDAGLSNGDTVLDIGAGSGSITRGLAAQCRRVVAYEADVRLADRLRDEFVQPSNVQVVRGDFLQAQLPTKHYKVFANVPFNRTSDIVRKLLDAALTPDEAYLIMQRDAAQKFMGSAGNHSLFATLHEPWFSMSITHRFKREDFMPSPNVAVVLLCIKRRTPPLIEQDEKLQFRDLVTYVYNHANPNILPALQKLFPGRAFTGIEQAFGAKVTAKPSQLDLNDWLALLDRLRSAPSDGQHLIAGASSKQKNEAAAIEKHHRTRSAADWRKTA